MNEIEKLYKNANVKPVCDGLDCFTCTAKCNNGKYPEFTVEKQLELIKFISAQRFHCILGRINGLPTFEASLARLINYIWQALSEEDKLQLKGILE